MLKRNISLILSIISLVMTIVSAILLYIPEANSVTFYKWEIGIHLVLSVVIIVFAFMWAKRFKKVFSLIVGFLHIALIVMIIILGVLALWGKMKIFAGMF